MVHKSSKARARLGEHEPRIHVGMPDDLEPHVVRENRTRVGVDGVRLGETRHESTTGLCKDLKGVVDVTAGRLDGAI